MVIAGAGFGGLAAARELAGAPVDVVLIDRHNYHLFQPLLYQVATAALSPGDVAWPIRGIVRDCLSVLVLLDEVQNIDPGGSTVSLATGELHYDYLIIATGVRHNYFGHDDWEQYAPGLKSIEDSTAIRKRILLAFERAEMSYDEDIRQRNLTFVIVGGGPTGVELAGAIIELARKALAADFRRINTRLARVILIEAGDHLLATFHADLSAYARRALIELGVEVRCGAPITNCTSDGVYIGDEFIAAATVLWAAGIAAGPAADWLGVDSDAQGRIIVTDDLSVPGLENVFVIGDAASIADQRGRPVPGVAPAAKQAGRHVARVIGTRIDGRPPPAAFRYRNWGDLATIGRHRAIIDFGKWRLKGYLAWWIWGSAHVYFLIGVRNRLLVAIEWFWSYITFQRGARLITDHDARQAGPVTTDDEP